jgi:hypothetical protein
MADTEAKNLEDRVSRLEVAVNQLAFRFPIGPIVDPAGPFGGGGGGGVRPPHGPIGDPAPIDFSRFSAAQLQASLHSISAEKTRLAALEELINQQLKKAK